MKIDKMDLLLKSQELRRMFGENENSTIDIFSLVASIESITLVRYPMSENFSGLCVKEKGVSLIAVNSKMTIGRQRFSLAHELFHLYYDSSMTAICYAEIGSGSEIERSADIFASYFLIPPLSLKKDIAELESRRATGRINVDDVVYLEQKYGVSRQAILVRLLDEKCISKYYADNMKSDVISSARYLGYSSELYLPSPEKDRYGTFGCMIKQANAALSKSLISVGKYEEILLQAFRPDIVYGDDGGGEVFD